MTTTQSAQALAMAALPYWGTPVGLPRLVSIRENVVFDATLAGIGRVALRLHRPGYQSKASIEAELVWSGQLAGAGLRVPEPVRTRRGALTVRVGDRRSSVVRWLPGEPIGSAEMRLAGTAKAQNALMASVGRLIASLHDATDRLDLAGRMPRPVWDADGFLGDRPLWGPFWSNPAFTEEEMRLIDEARQAARLMMPARAEADFGLIHADVLRENVLDDRGCLSLIDFDDSGWGYRLYDLATALVQSLEEPCLRDIAGGLVAGYAETRPLPANVDALLPLFVMLRTSASAGWIATRASADDPRQRFYAERAVRMARHVLGGDAPWV